MKNLSRGSVALLPGLLVAALGVQPVLAKDEEVSVSYQVGRLLEEGHYTRHPLDDEISRRLLTGYLEQLDFSHLFFTQKDIDIFTKKYASALDEDILLGNLEPAEEIFAVFQKRVEDRVKKIKELVKQPVDFKSNETVLFNRQKAPWPKDEAEADQLWTDRIANELLQEKLTEHPIEPGPKLVERRYDRLLRNIREENSEGRVSIFLDALAQSYDSHSHYFSQTQLKDPSINRGLLLVGIGAMLRSEDGYARIESLVPGGPAQKSGKVKVGDRITAVAQDAKDFNDVRDMRLDKVVEQIRGKKGTKVRLRIIPASAADPSQHKMIELVRDEIKPKDQEARADIIIKKDGNGDPVKLGWLTLPSFYDEMAGKKKSMTRDVLALFKRLKKEKIGGLVIDLRRTEGGSLEEAISSAGLFFKSGPVVQTKRNSYNPVIISTDPDPNLAYDGPLVVLTSRQTASESEIFAAALQDYGRAVIVGDKSTFGNGTGQRFLQMELFTSHGDGALRYTMEKFYRVAGGSTQLHGVTSDIVLPTLTDLPDFGEGALHNPLPYDEVPAAKFTKWPDAHHLFIDELKARSALRVAAAPEFHYIMEDLELLRKKLDSNRLILNEDVRRKELGEEKARKETRAKERLARNTEKPSIYRLTLETVDSSKLQAAPDAVSDDGGGDSPPNTSDGSKPAAVDPERDETLNILSDLVQLTQASKTSAVH